MYIHCRPIRELMKPVWFSFGGYFAKVSLCLHTSLKNLSTHESSISGPITDVRTSRNSWNLIPRSSFPPLSPPRLLCGSLSCRCTPVFGQLKAFLRSCRCSGLSFSAGLTPQAGSLQKDPHSIHHLKKNVD